MLSRPPLSLGTLADPFELTGVVKHPAAELPTQTIEWFDFDARLPNRYVGIQTTTPAGMFFHAFTPSQLIVQEAETWEHLKQQLNLFCLIGLLPSDQVNSLTKTVYQFFVDTKEGQEIAASYSELPCFKEPATHPLPASVEEAFDDLSKSANPPHPDALQLAKSWAESLFTEIKLQGDTCILPHLTVQDGGDVVFEWWKGPKSLSVYVSPNEVWFLQSAGPNSVQTEGIADTQEARHKIWQWLTE